MQIKRPLIYKGNYDEPSTTSTDKLCSLKNDYQGTAQANYSNKTDGYLYYSFLTSTSGSGGDSSLYILPSIAAGTITQVTQPTPALNNDDGYTIILDHGNGWRTHYKSTDLPFYMPTDGSGSGTEITAPGGVVAEGGYIYIRPTYSFGWTRTRVFIALEHNGVYIDPRTLDNGSNIPPLVTDNFRVGSNYQATVGLVNPINTLDIAKPKEGTIFSPDASTLQVMEGDVVKLNKAFFDSVPAEYKATAYVRFDGFSWENVAGETWRYADTLFVKVGVNASTYRFRLNKILVAKGENVLDGKKFYAADVAEDVEIGTWVNGDVVVWATMDNKHGAYGNQHIGMLVGTGATPSPPEPPIDGGVGPDEGGGNQTWGQGNTSVKTEGGTFDNTSDTISMGTGTSIKAGQTYNNYFSLNLQQVFEVKEKVWGLSIPMLTRPSEGIISLLCFPFDLSSMSFDTQSNIVPVGNSFMEMTTNVSMLNANFDNSLSFGTLKLDRYFGGFQDFAPYTRIRLYLPFIGFVDIDPAFAQNRVLEVKYNVNATSGSCIISVYSGGFLYQRYNAQLGQSVPLTQVNNGLIEATANTAIQSVMATAVNPLAGVASAGLGTLANVVNSRPSISGSAGGGGECELSMPLECFLEITRPRCAIAQTYNGEKGRPSLVNKMLSNCKGYTVMANPRLRTSATASENDEINAKLKEGVIING